MKLWRKSVFSESHPKQSMLESAGGQAILFPFSIWGRVAAHTVYSQNSSQMMLKCPVAPSEDCYGFSPDLRGSLPGKKTTAQPFSASTH